ncbi:MAG: MFS transporter [Acetobacteraceae bacterium]
MKSGLFADEPLSPAARRTIIAGFVGFAVDFFDIYLPVLALAPVIGYFEPKGLSSAAGTTIYYFTFAATLLGRPCGAVIFGHWADKIGRRRCTIISIAGFGILTALLALLPGYSSLGIWALVLLVALRFIDGVFMGGEYTSNNTLALEMVPRERRGFVGGLMQAAYPVGFAAVSLVTSIMLGVTTKAQYYQWGWRIPFLLGGAFALAFLIYYRRVPESQMWQETEKSAAPLREVMTGPHQRSLGQVFLMMSGFWLAAQAASVLPGIMIQHLHVPGELTSNGFLLASILQFFGFIGCALFSQMIGRRPAIAWCGIFVMLGSPALYFLTVAHALGGGTVIGTTALAGLFYALVLAPWGIATPYICERFPTQVRATGYGMGYSVAVVIPAFAGFYLLGLSKLMPYVYTPMVLLVLGGALMIVGALLGPETRQVELHRPDLGAAPARMPGLAP